MIQNCFVSVSIAPLSLCFQPAKVAGPVSSVSAPAAPVGGVSAIAGALLSRQIVIALLPNLCTLNGCLLQPNERKNAERYFLSLGFRQNPVCLDADPTKEHLQRLELVHKTGLFNPSTAAAGTVAADGTRNASPSSSSAVVDVVIESVFAADDNRQDGKSAAECGIRRKLPLWMKISSLRLICSRLFRIPINKQKLFLINKAMPYPVELNEDSLTLDFYGLDKNCKIVVEENVC